MPQIGHFPAGHFFPLLLTQRQLESWLPGEEERWNRGQQGKGLGPVLPPPTAPGLCWGIWQSGEAWD